jgi:hypothetical protein
MSKVLAALAMLLSLSLFGAPAASAVESSPATVVKQDGDKGKKKHGQKKHKKGKGKKKGGKSGKNGKKNNRKKHHKN